MNATIQTLGTIAIVLWCRVAALPTSVICMRHVAENTPAQHLILATVNGQVTYADEITNTFNQVFILKAEGKDLKIVYDCYRCGWVPNFPTCVCLVARALSSFGAKRSDKE